MTGNGIWREGEVPRDGAQRRGDPTTSLLREQDLLLLYLDELTAIS
jgi:hypothetical protein